MVVLWFLDGGIFSLRSWGISGHKPFWLAAEVGSSGVFGSDPSLLNNPRNEYNVLLSVADLYLLYVFTLHLYDLDTNIVINNLSNACLNDNVDFSQAKTALLHLPTNDTCRMS